MSDLAELERTRDHCSAESRTLSLVGKDNHRQPLFARCPPAPFAVDPIERAP